MWLLLLATATYGLGYTLELSHGFCLLVMAACSLVAGWRIALAATIGWAFNAWINPEMGAAWLEFMAGTTLLLAVAASIN